MRILRRLGEFFEDEVTGKLSHTKLWANIGNATMTVGFARIVWTATATEGIALLFGIYGGLVAGSQFASKLLSWRMGKPPEPEAPK